MTLHSRLQTNVLAKFLDITWIFRDTEAAAAVRVDGNGNLYKRKTIVTNYVCFCSSTLVTLKITTEIIENHSEFSGCPNSCNKFVSSRS